jgi:hypothetical protein
VMGSGCATCCLNIEGEVELEGEVIVLLST